MVITVSAISGVVNSLPKKLQQLEQQPFALSSLDHQSIGRLKDEVEVIRDAFEQYSTHENPTEFTRQWVQKVREVAFDIEESIDRYINGVGDDVGNNVAASGGGIAGTLSRLAGYLVGKMKRGPAHRRSISDELKLQQERLHVQILEKPAIMATTTAKPDLSLPQTTATTLVSRHQLVGMDDARKEVTAMVLDGDTAAGIKVISIVGMAGAGKTSLANEVYSEPGIAEHFRQRAFISVGRRPDALRKILQGLLPVVADDGNDDSVLYQDTINMDELKLKAIIRDRLQHKRYLLVLDDLWSTETWQEVWPCFSKNNLGSIVVTTTRIEAVAKACCSSHSDCIFRIPLLNESDSETLFYRMAFDSKKHCPPELKDVSMHILRKCNGLPLAIVNIAAALKNKTSLTDSTLKDFELDSQHNMSTYLHGMKEIFDRSYNDIPPQLKTCLLYLSIFPEKHEIRRQRLVRRWIAEGFIGEEDGADKEETAKKYFDELIDRNLVQPVQVDYDGNARSCRVHPVMLDFIVCKSMEENFVTLVHPGAAGGQQDDHTPSSNSAIRWLTVQCRANNSEEGQGHGTAAQTKESAGLLSHTRSLSVFGEVGAMPQLKKMEMLRVLDLEDCQGSSLDSSIDVLPMLFLLRYLSLRGTQVTRLPPQIGSLRHLETIDIRSTRIQELPPSIVHLHNLVHLLAGMIPLPRGVGKLTALRTLSFADIMSSTASAVQELAHLTNLMELAIFCSQEYKVHLLPVLQKLAGHGLRSLIVAGSSGCWMEPSHSLPTPPRYSFQRFKIDGRIVLNEATLNKLVDSSWANLVEMDINFHVLSAQGLSVLESIGSLLRLCLCIVSVEQGQLTFRGFPSLKELCFRCRNLPSLSFGAGALPMLQQLELNFRECSSSSSLEPIVSGLDNLQSLMQVAVAFPREDVGTKVVADVRKAALLHPKHPDVVVKTGKEFSSVGATEFEDLHRLSSDTSMVPQVEKKSYTDSLHENLLRIQIMTIVSWFSNAQKINAGQSGLLFGLLCVLLTFILQYVRVLRSESNWFKGTGIYVETGVSVVIAYVLLILINFQYYILVPFLICLLGFITYLGKKILVNGKLQQQCKRSEETKKSEELKAKQQCPNPSNDDKAQDRKKTLALEATKQYASPSKDDVAEDRKKIEALKATQQYPSPSKDDVAQDSKKIQALEATQQCPSPSKDEVAQERKKIEELLATAILPYFALLISAQYGDGSAAPSHFLLFSCCALGMLALMYSRLANDVSPGLTRALRWIQMAYMVLMFITAHTMAAEWLGEVVALVCIPELIAGLVWFSTFLHGGISSYRARGKVATHDDGFLLSIPLAKVATYNDALLFIPLGAVLAILTSNYGYEGDFLGSWYTQAMVCCAVAGCMLYLSVWMISRWPGSIPGSDKATQLLKFPANICLTGACLMLFAVLAQKTLAHGLFGLDHSINPGSLKYLPGIYFTVAVAWLVALYVKPRAAR